MKPRSEFELALQSQSNRLQDDDFAQAVYAALCNMQWRKISNPEEIYSCSWRYAAGLVAQLRGKGEDYLDFYLLGIGAGGVPEGQVVPSVLKFFKELGWEPLPY